MKIEVESYECGVVRIHMDIHNRNGALDKVAAQRISKDFIRGWRTIAHYALYYKGYKRLSELIWLQRTPTEATFTVEARKVPSKYERLRGRPIYRLVVHKE